AAGPPCLRARAAQPEQQCRGWRSGRVPGAPPPEFPGRGSLHELKPLSLLESLQRLEIDRLARLRLKFHPYRFLYSFDSNKPHDLFGHGLMLSPLSDDGNPVML